MGIDLERTLSRQPETPPSLMSLAVPRLPELPILLREAAARAKIDLEGSLSGQPEALLDEHGKFFAWRLEFKRGAMAARKRTPSNWEKRCRMYHGTSCAGLEGILRDGAVLPRPEPEGCGMHGVYCTGFEDNDKWWRDAAVVEWCLQMRASKIKAVFGSTCKNGCGIVIEMLMTADVKSLKVLAGGNEEELVRPGLATHKPRDHMSRYCVHPDDLQITALIVDPEFNAF